MAKTKGTKGQTMIHKQTKTLHRRLKIEQHEPPLKIGSECRCSGSVSSSCSTCDIRRSTPGVINRKGDVASVVVLQES